MASDRVCFRAVNARKAVAAIEKYGVLLVFPLDNRPEPPSLWSAFYPRTKMRWEWDDEGDNRVSDLWHLRSELSRSGKVVYAKWFRGRATFFSREIFPAFRALLGQGEGRQIAGLDDHAREILGALDLDSPLSTKQLKEAVGLRGKANESTYERALKQLWAKLLIVGFGEFDDGAFPSLGIGSTRLLFEDLWQESRELSRDDAWARIHARMPSESLFVRQLAKGSSAPVLATP